MNEGDFSEPFGLDIYDMDRDGVKDILIGTDHGTVEVYQGDTYQKMWNVSLSESDWIIDCIRVGNVDDDAGFEVVVAFNSGPWSGGLAIFDVDPMAQHATGRFVETHTLAL